MTDYEHRIDDILGRAYDTSYDRGQAVREYNETFRHEGERKTAFILNKLAELDAATQAALGGYVAVSIGGSDASDLLAIVSNTPIKRAIVLEYDNEAADAARNHTKPKIEAQGGRLEIIVGDAGQQLDAVRSLLEKEKAQGANGLLCICLAVIHELPSRSPDFNLDQYLTRLCTVLPNNLVFLSEPCAPQEPDTRLQLKVSIIHEDRLAELASHVNAHLFKGCYKIHKFAQGFVEMEFRLVMETLHKLLRYNEIPRFRHEMGERLTEYGVEDLRRAVLMALPHAAFEVLSKTSEGFRTAYIEAGVAIRDVKGQAVPMPFSHVQVSGVSLVRGADSSKILPQSKDTPAVRQPGRIALRNAGTPGGTQQTVAPAAENLPEVEEVRKQLRGLSLLFLKVFERALAAKERALVVAADASAIAASARDAVVAKRPDYLDVVPKAQELVPLPSNRRQKEKPEFLDTVPTGTGSEALGILVYNSYDEFQGRFQGQTPYGLGVYKVYPYGHSFTPNDIHYYRGQVEGKYYRGIGVYEFDPTRYVAGDWVDAHPHFGVMAPCYHPALFDYYCGSLGTVERENGGTLWVPHGDGVGVSLLRNEIVFGSFHCGEALKNCQTVPVRPGLGSPLAPAAAAQTSSPPRGSAPALVPSRPLKSDLYSSFSALARAEEPGSFAVNVEPRSSAVAVMAPHGGGIEPGTLQIARAIAGSDLSWYTFDGKLNTGNERLHITSIYFDEPTALEVAASAESVLTVHGSDDEEPVVYVGGLDQGRKDRITASLLTAGFEVREHHRPEMQGVYARNICNRGRSGRGVQLEVSAGLRCTMFKDLTREGTQTTTPAFDAFVASVRGAIIL